MAFAIRGRIEGIDDAVRALDAVEKKIRRKAIRKAALAAGTILLTAARKHARRKTGLLRRSLGKKVKFYGGVAVAVVGPRLGFRQEVVRDGRKVVSNPTRYAHLVELGTSRARAYPFLRPALEQTRDQVANAMRRAIHEVIEKSAVK